MNAVARRHTLTVVSRACASLVVLAASITALWAGGSRESAPSPPRPIESVVRAEEAKRGDAGMSTRSLEQETAERLVDRASHARFEMPYADEMRRVLDAHWRKHALVYSEMSPDASRFVANVALRRSAREAQWAVPLGREGTPWVPDVRVWNMNEGSFDQREAFLSPGPGSIAMRVTVPRGGSFEFSEGTLNATAEATVFMVRVVDSRGRVHDVYRHVLEPDEARTWKEASVSLVEFAGQEIELQLSTEATAPSPGRREPASTKAEEASESGEREHQGPGNGRPSVDAGVIHEEALTTPSRAVALWGNPILIREGTARVPYNVLWIVVDALRADVVAGLHDDVDDARKRAAPQAPLEALLPKVEGLTPELDALVRRGVRFTNAYSAGSWTRPGTLAMLSGARSGELGIDATAWVPKPHERRRFYLSDPPLLPLLLRRQGVLTRAFVNNYFFAGYAPIGLDFGFERVVDHRYRTKDTLEITRDASEWIRDHRASRFFAFVNYTSPHEPYEPPARFLARVPPAPEGPRDPIARLYMAEAAKDDEAIGVLMRTLDEAQLRDRTIVVVTADHGETLSSAHVGTSGLDNTPIRYHHSASNYEETTIIQIVLALPSALPSGATVRERVRSTDLAPTVLELLGLETPRSMSGQSLCRLARGGIEPSERVVVSEGRGSRALAFGRWRLIVYEGLGRVRTHGGERREIEHELFDLETDPGERVDVSSKHPEIVDEMKGRLAAALANAPLAGVRTPQDAAAASEAAPRLRMRFVSAGVSRRISGTIAIGDAARRAQRMEVSPVELPSEAIRRNGAVLELAFRTSPDKPVGLELEVEPPSTPVSWSLWLDDAPWPRSAVFAGPYGLPTDALYMGMMSTTAPSELRAAALPFMDPRRDFGLFVTRESSSRADESTGPEAAASDEMARLLREWGYAHGGSGAH